MQGYVLDRLPPPNSAHKCGCQWFPATVWSPYINRSLYSLVTGCSAFLWTIILLQRIHKKLARKSRVTSIAAYEAPRLVLLLWSQILFCMTLVYDHNKFKFGPRQDRDDPGYGIVGETVGDTLFQAVLSALDVYLITSLGLFLCSKFPDSRWEAQIKSVVFVCTVSTLVLALGGGLWDDLKNPSVNITEVDTFADAYVCSNNRWVVLVGPDIIRVVVCLSLLWQQYQMRSRPDGIDALYRRRREAMNPGDTRSEFELFLERSGCCDIYYNVWRRHELRRPGLLVAGYVLWYALIDIFCVSYFELGPTEYRNTTLCYLYLNQALFNVLLPVIMVKTMKDDALYWRLYTATLLEEAATELPESTIRSFKKYLMGVHEWRIFDNETLGFGTEAIVYKACIGTGPNFNPENMAACKQWEMSGEDESIQKVIHEAGLLLYGQHENVVKMKGLCIHPPNVCILMEYCELGNYLKLLLNKGIDELPLAHRLRIAYKVSKGMKALHARGIIHRDLKSDNVLLKKDGTVKLSDFGLARRVSHARMEMDVGTPYIQAPELQGIKGEKRLYGREVDVFSFGFVLYQSVCSLDLPIRAPDPSNPCVPTRLEPPREGNSAPTHLSQDMLMPDCPPQVLALIQRCWSAPNDRPTFHEITTELKQITHDVFQAMPVWVEPLSYELLSGDVDGEGSTERSGRVTPIFDFRHSDITRIDSQHPMASSLSSVDVTGTAGYSPLDASGDDLNEERLSGGLFAGYRAALLGNTELSPSSPP